MAACSFNPLALLGSGRSKSPPILLDRCDRGQVAICLVTFGIEPPDKMLIELLAAASVDGQLDVVVTHKGEDLPFACMAADEGNTLFYCTGKQLPLGSALHIEVYAVQGRALLASGDFQVNAFELPELPLGGTPFPEPSLASIGRVTRTPFAGTAYPNSMQAATRSPTATRTPTPTPRLGASPAPGIYWTPTPRAGATPNPNLNPNLSP